MQIEKEELSKLVEARGPPGDEYEVANVYSDLIEPYVDSVERDSMGNIIATIENDGNPDAPEVMYAAHTDELAVLVDQIRDDGHLSYTMLGGHYKGNFPGQQVLVGPDKVPGVIGAKPRHYMTTEEKESLPDELLIDVGADSPDEVADLNIEAGDFATWDRELTELAKNRLAGRALDDRIALAILLSLARNADPEGTVHFVASVQEEVGLRGARAVGASVDPDIGIALEIFPADDYHAAGDENTVELGEGPVVEFADGTDEYLFNGMIVDRQTRRWLKDAAAASDVSLQHAVMVGGTTDATEFQQVHGGRHAGAIAVPCRYTHSPVETIDLDDVSKTVEVLAEALNTEFPTPEEAHRR